VKATIIYKPSPPLALERELRRLDRARRRIVADAGGDGRSKSLDQLAAVEKEVISALVQPEPARRSIQ